MSALLRCDDHGTFPIRSISRPKHCPECEPVMLQRVLDGEPLQRVADTYGLTRERVRQIVTALDPHAAQVGRAVRREARRVRAEVKREQRRAAHPTYGVPQHGTRHCYIYYRCRCADCRAAQARHQRGLVLGRIKTAIPATVPHGRNSTYVNWACRCEACCAVHSAYMSAYKARRSGVTA